MVCIAVKDGDFYTFPNLILLRSEYFYNANEIHSQVFLRRNSTDFTGQPEMVLSYFSSACLYGTVNKINFAISLQFPTNT